MTTSRAMVMRTLHALVARQTYAIAFPSEEPEFTDAENALLERAKARNFDWDRYSPKDLEIWAGLAEKQDDWKRQMKGNQ